MGSERLGNQPKLTEFLCGEWWLETFGGYLQSLAASDALDPSFRQPDAPTPALFPSYCCWCPHPNPTPAAPVGLSHTAPMPSVCSLGPWGGPCPWFLPGQLPASAPAIPLLPGVQRVPGPSPTPWPSCPCLHLSCPPPASSSFPVSLRVQLLFLPLLPDWLSGAGSGALLAQPWANWSLCKAPGGQVSSLEGRNVPKGQGRAFGC